MDTNLLQNKTNIHFIGIGGSGMFPIAQILHSEGFIISGSDNNESDTLNLVRNMGAKVFMGQKASNILGADLIVHSAAIMSDNEELVAAKNSGIPTVERSIMLGEITRRYGNAICISGTHGKTTTTAMITQILMNEGFDPTAVIGGRLDSIGGNGRAGKSDIMVCEACEFVDTFLKLSPDTTLLLNIDEDHMDYFKTMDNLINSFHTFSRITSGKIIANGDDENVRKAISGLTNPIITFGTSQSNDYYPTNIVINNGIHTDFDLMHQGVNLGTLSLFIPGKHNVLNAVAAVVAAMDAGATFTQAKNGLATFKGAGRRFEVLGTVNDITVVDDYAHHPAEIKVTLEATKTMHFKRVIAIHQPFTYSRTKLLLDDFAKALSIADVVILSDIMAAREKNNFDIHSKDLANKIEDSIYLPTFDLIADYVCEIVQPGDLIITLGCGDIYKVAKIVLNKLKG